MDATARELLGERFATKIAVNDATGCWLWTASTHPTNGYGMFRIGSRIDNSQRCIVSHRFAWTALRGPVPVGLCVLHNCPGGDNPRCVNPAHLFLGTRTENNRDRDRKGRGARPVGMPGEANPSAKLSDAAVRSIRHALARGVPQATIASERRVSQTTISRISTGHRRRAG